MSKLEDFLGLVDVQSMRKAVKAEIGGKEFEFIVRPLTQDEHSEFQRRCISIGESSNFDIGKYNSLMLDACIVEPNFKDAEFLRKVGCQTAAEFRNRKFPTAVITMLSNEISEMSGFGGTINDDVEAAKN